MKKKLNLLMAIVFVAILFSGCAEDNYNSSYNSYDRKMDNAAKADAYEISNNLSTQDLQNLNNLK